MFNYKSLVCALSTFASCICFFVESTTELKNPLHLAKRINAAHANNSYDSLIPKSLWNLGFAIASDVTPFKNGLPPDYTTWPAHPCVTPSRYVRAVENGDIIWVQSVFLSAFYRDVFPYINKKFILVVNDGDESFPSFHRQVFDVDQLINDERVIHIFAQNVDCNHSKITHLPIGIDFHSIARSTGYFGEPQMTPVKQGEELEKLLTELLPTNQRLKRAYVDFQLADRGTFDGESRTSIFFKIIHSGVIDAAPHYLARHVLWREKGKYAFSVSPRGNGLDCHRTWEDLILGCIVIVKKSPLDPMYEGLPVVIVNDWSEINQENMDRWLEQYGDVFNNPRYREKLTHQYWMNLIKSYQKPYKT